MVTNLCLNTHILLTVIFLLTIGNIYNTHPDPVGYRFLFFKYFEGFTSIPTALTANDRNRRIQVYKASDG